MGSLSTASLLTHTGSPHITKSFKQSNAQSKLLRSNSITPKTTGMIDTNTSKTRTVASTELIKRAKLCCPVKQRQALLESNPPTDNWIERRRNKYVSTFGEAKTSPNAKKHTFISEPEHALKNSSQIQTYIEKSFEI